MRLTSRIACKVFLLCLVLSVLLSNCDSHHTDSKLKKETPKDKAECIEPQNPYNDGGGHDAGFNWARENGGDCNGNSTSFNEGCAEYHRQLERYNECVARSRQ